MSLTYVPQNLNAEIDNVVGSVFVAAASVAYYGAFTSDYRAAVSTCACMHACMHDTTRCKYNPQQYYYATELLSYNL